MNLRIGWDRFEKLCLAVSRDALGLRGVKFRRYGVPGQAQHGIDLSGRRPDGKYTVIQCKEYQEFTAGDLRSAVEKFANGRRPFGAHHLVIATSASIRSTQVEDELATLQDEHPTLELDLWGAEQINDVLRFQGDVVARFWSRETAAAFCTGAPLPGVPVPLPDRQEQAEKVLIGPLRTRDVASILQQADAQRSTEPTESARLYGVLAARLQDAGFRGHADTMRHKQLASLVDAQLTDQAIALAAHLAVAAIHFGDRVESRTLLHRIQELISHGTVPDAQQTAIAQRHAELIHAAVHATLHPLGDFTDLRTVLETPARDEPDYQPLLVLLLAEQALTSEPDGIQSLDSLISTAVTNAYSQAIAHVTEDAVIRLRLVRAEYDAGERGELLALARRHRVPGRHAALIHAREARRCVLESRAEEAVEAWQDAVHEAIHAGLTEDAADWLYAVRAVHVQFGPLTSDIEDEHHLAQGLRATGTGRLLDRVRSPREHALSALVREKPVEAALSARRWLTDSVITGNWASETEALHFLADLYAANREPGLAADYHQRAGNVEKIRKLAAAVGDLLLPVGPVSNVPWWVLHARATLIEAQADLLSDDSACALLGELTDLAERGRAGELVDSPFRHLAHQLVKSACALAARGTPQQAVALLEVLASDVPRDPGRYSLSDDDHARACVRIATTHHRVAMSALTRLFDLASAGARKALELAADDEVIDLLTGRQGAAGAPERTDVSDGLSEDDRSMLLMRAARLDEEEHYLADVVRSRVDPGHPSVRERAEQARDRILRRSDPDPHRTAFGTRLVRDAYLVSSLDAEIREVCLDKLISIASDRREVAVNRKDALAGARNLVIGMPADVRRKTFRTAEPFVLGEQDGSHLDDEVAGTPHPLSSFKVSLGSASLRGHALRLAATSAVTSDEHTWVREQATALLRSEDTADLNAAAVTLSRLPQDVAAEVDVDLLAAHGHADVRQAGSVLSRLHLVRYQDTAMRLAQDDDFRVRLTLAHALAQEHRAGDAAAGAILEFLARDPRHSVRVAARGQV
ncbi:hypothetical protein [Streptomyces chrestomyceticus]|uniref:hypothetical protein n=1 Tax=Streptomyces chrestomyceticus TaxID=68185 RepID=UPI0033C5B32B